MRASLPGAMGGVVRGIFLVSAVIAMTGTSSPLAASPTADYLAFREKRLQGLKREDGWLALCGLHWLEEGENRFEGIPGVFILERGKVRLEQTSGEGWTLNGVPVTSREIVTDEAEKPDRFRSGTKQLTVIKRGPKVALRVWDSASKTRNGFHGIDSFPYEPRFRLEAHFEAFTEPKEVLTPSIIGIPERETVPGRVTFTIDGRSYSLEPTVEKPDGPLFFVFRDETSKKETYGAGRFLYADPPKDGKVLLDFNKAYNPPCVFTPYATCPLPRPENVLSVRIEAGEKRYGDH